MEIVKTQNKLSFDNWAKSQLSDKISQVTTYSVSRTIPASEYMRSWKINPMEVAFKEMVQDLGKENKDNAPCFFERYISVNKDGRNLTVTMRVLS